MRKNAVIALFIVALVSVAGFAGASQRRQVTPSESVQWGPPFNDTFGDSIDTADWFQLVADHPDYDIEGNSLDPVPVGQKNHPELNCNNWHWPCITDRAHHIDGGRHVFLGFFEGEFDDNDRPMFGMLEHGARCDGTDVADTACVLWGQMCEGSPVPLSFTIPSATAYLCTSFAAGTPCRNLCAADGNEVCTMTSFSKKDAPKEASRDESEEN